MRILTVRQPWAWAIIHAGKDVENRVRNVAGSYRGPVAIHAARKGAEDEACVEVWGRWCDTLDPDVRGAIIGVVDLVDVHKGYCDTDDYPICSEWAAFDQWHLEIANPRPLAEPIPYRGALGLRTLDDDTTARILAQIGA
jgi:hypothetical protein